MAVFRAVTNTRAPSFALIATIQTGGKGREPEYPAISCLLVRVEFHKLLIGSIDLEPSSELQRALLCRKPRYGQNFLRFRHASLYCLSKSRVMIRSAQKLLRIWAPGSPFPYPPGVRPPFRPCKGSGEHAPRKGYYRTGDFFAPELVLKSAVARAPGGLRPPSGCSASRGRGPHLKRGRWRAHDAVPG